MMATSVVRRIVTGIAGLLLAFTAVAQAPAPDATAVAAAKKTFIDRLVKQHAFDRAELTSLLDKAQITQSVLDAMSKPAERVVPWFQYRRIFLKIGRAHV